MTVQKNNLTFFTPLIFETETKTIKERTTEFVDSYFHFFGKEAHVTKERMITFSYPKPSLKTYIKSITILLSYTTVFIPIIFFIVKIALRSSYTALSNQQIQGQKSSISREGTKKPIQEQLFQQNLQAVIDITPVETISKPNTQPQSIKNAFSVIDEKHQKDISKLIAQNQTIKNKIKKLENKINEKGLTTEDIKNIKLQLQEIEQLQISLTQAIKNKKNLKGESILNS